ncbi:MAG: phosphoglucosamine mutase [Phycisphaerales bacterium]|nr:phosphoglucosamine mutase [Phycisphaerales bacterium]
MLSVSGCRGIVGSSLTAEVAARFAGSYASWLIDRAAGKPVTVVIGRDGRAGCQMVHSAALAGLISGGCDVVDLGVAMTPTIAVLTDAYRAESGADGVVAGLVLTASHNPQEWNGLKCLLAESGEFGSAACAPPAAFAGQIINRFKSGEVRSADWNEIGEVTDDDAGVESHIDRVIAALEEAGLTRDASTLGNGLNIAVDSVNASGVRGSYMCLEALGVEEILHLGAEDTGIFPHPPEPTAENLSLPGGLCEAVRENESDIGFAQDPDADRLAIVDELGRYIGEEYTLALSALAVLEGMRQRGEATHGRILVTNLSTSRMIDDIAARYGARVMRTAVGEANVVETMKAHNALLGGEGNGGTIWPRVTYVRDSLTSMALMLWLISPSGGGKDKKRKLSEVIAGLPSYAIRKRKVDLARREDAQAAVEKIAAAYKSQRVDLQDGAWVDFANGPLAGKAWLHVRASNTEPIMRLIAEAPTEAEAQQLLADATKTIQ